MRIESSTVQMTAARSYRAESQEAQTTIHRTYNGDEVKSASASTLNVETSQRETEVSTAVYHTSSAGFAVSDQTGFTNQLTDTEQRSTVPQAAAAPILSLPSSGGDWLSALQDTEEDPELTLLRRMLELLERCTGKKFSYKGFELSSKLSAPAGQACQRSVSVASARYQQVAAMLGGQDFTATTGGSRGSVNGHWTRQTIRSGFVSGEETTAFSSCGTAVTADGRVIQFGISLEMSQRFAAAYEVVGAEEVYTDPLVINLDTKAAALSDVSFFFDLNCDGVEEELSGLDAASGFLALDKNGDGEINNGSELFGTVSGNGFADLAQYDEDGNGWIDEGDSVFSKLSVWVKCGTGDARLLSLSEADVGAIFLGSQSTRFSLMDAFGETDAMVRQTGVYLKESGQVGTVQHLDFKT